MAMSEPTPADDSEQNMSKPGNGTGNESIEKYQMKKNSDKEINYYKFGSLISRFGCPSIYRYSYRKPICRIQPDGLNEIRRHGIAKREFHRDLKTK